MRWLGVVAVVGLGACTAGASKDDTDDVGDSDAVDETDDVTLPDTDETDAGKDTDETDSADTDVADTDTDVPDDTGDTDDSDAADTDVPPDTDDTDVPPDTDDTDVPPDTDDTDIVVIGVDDDADGWDAGIDCDDDDELVNPGVNNLCGDIDRSCGYDDVNPAATVAKRSSAGVWTDLTATWAAATPGTPVDAAVFGGEAVHVCAGTWAARVAMTGSSTLAGHGAAVLAPGTNTYVVFPSGGDATVSGLKLVGSKQAGQATVEVSAGYPEFIDVVIDDVTAGYLLFNGGSVWLERGSVTRVTEWAIDTQFAPRTTSDAFVTDTVFSGAATATAIATLGDGDIDSFGASFTGFGTGLVAEEGDVTVEETTFTNVGKPIEHLGTSGLTTLGNVEVSGATEPLESRAEFLTIGDSIFRDGAAGLKVSAPTANLIIGTTTFARLSDPTARGTAVWVQQGATVTLDDTTFEDITSQYGALYTSAPAEVYDVTFRGGEAVSGAGLYLADGAVDSRVARCVFEDNHTTDDGAGLYAASGGDVAIEDTRFEGNESDQDGGGLYVGGTPPGAATLTDVVFDGNTGVRGGGVFARRLTSTGGTYIDNQATHGGALFLAGLAADQSLTDETFAGNSVTGSGGAIAWTDGLSATAITWGPAANTPTEGAWVEGSPVSVPISASAFSCLDGVCTPTP